MRKPINYDFYTKKYERNSIIKQLIERRRGNLSLFFRDRDNKKFFIMDNIRFYYEMSNDVYYTTSLHITSYKQEHILTAFHHLYESSSENNERYYIKLMRKSSLTERCPYCLNNMCNTLDHYYDKSNYPELSLNPWNLIPVCGECNLKKLNHQNERVDRFINPYFDNLAQGIYNVFFIELDVRLKNEKEFILFNLIASRELKTRFQQTVNWHINKLGLKDIYMNTISCEIRLFIEDFVDSFIGMPLKNKKNYLKRYRKISNSEQLGWRAVVANSMLFNKNNRNKILAIAKRNDYVI